MVQFPEPIAQQITLTDNNGNAVIVIGPTPEIDIQAPAPFLSKIILSIDTVVNRPTMYFYDFNGINRYIIYNNIQGGTPSALVLGGASLTGPEIDINNDFDDPSTPLGTTIYGDFPIGVTVFKTNGFLYAARGNGRETWTTLPLTAGYTPLGPNVQFKLLPDGTVILRGTILANVNPIPAATVIATLPVGYRISQDAIMGVVFDSSATQGRIVIRTTGNIECYDAPNARPSMDGVQFSTI